MHEIPEPLSLLLCRVGERHLVFLLCFVLLFAMSSIVGGVLTALGLLALGVAAALIDLSCLKLAPTAFPSLDATRAARAVVIGGGVLVGFMALTSAATGAPWLHALLCLLVKLASVSAFVLVAYPSYRDDVFPLIQKLGEGTPEFEEALRERTALRGVEHRQRQERRAAVQDARKRVLSFYAQHRSILAHRFSWSWLDAEVQARIPDGSAEGDAYAAASALLSTLESAVRERQQKAQELDRRLGELRASRDALKGDSTLDAETREEELAELARRERELLGQRQALTQGT